MATARELLAQADALMRRNRPAGAERGAREIPVLTEVVAAGEGTPQVPPAPTQIEPWLGAAAQAPAPSAAVGAAEIPLLTDMVEDFAPIAIGGAMPDSEAQDWPEFGDEDNVADLTAHAATALEEGANLRAPAQGAPFPTEPPPAAPEILGTDAQAIPVPPREGETPRDTPGENPAARLPGAADQDAARWAALAEDVRMQVLQRIDIFTDTGLHEQLAARLQPIVDRASADLVATINQQVGQLLRGYVAEAIEREIDKWRHEGEH
jgi:hypothetical protein